MAPASDRQHAAIDMKILVTIDQVRSEHHACTARHVSSLMHLSDTAVHNRMRRMRGEFIEWTKVAGSVHLLPAGVERVEAWKADSAPVDRKGLPTGPTVTPTTTPADDQPVDVEAVVEQAIREALAAVGITVGGTPAPGGSLTAAPARATPAREGGSSRTIDESSNEGTV